MSLFNRKQRRAAEKATKSLETSSSPAPVELPENLRNRLGAIEALRQVDALIADGHFPGRLSQRVIAARQFLGALSQQAQTELEAQPEYAQYLGEQS